MTLQYEIRPELGLDTAEALGRLHDDIKETIDEFERRERLKWRRPVLGKYFDLRAWQALSWSNKLSCFKWSSAIILFLEFLSLFICYCIGSPSDFHLLVQGVILLFLLFFNLILAIWNNNLRHLEIPTRARWLLHILKQCQVQNWWQPANYPHLHSPISPCITLQATYRDGVLVNLPWALLVQGDTIVLKPGQVAPGKCVSIDDPTIVLDADALYVPVEVKNKSTDSPQARKPSPLLICTLETTPYVHNLSIVLEQALNRPVSVLENERYLSSNFIAELILIPVFWGSLVMVNLLRYLYLSSWIPSGKWAELFLLEPAAMILPLLPVFLPIAWLVLNAAGTSWLLALFYSARELQVSADPFDEAELPLALPTSLWSKCKQMKPYFLPTLAGIGRTPWRTENLLHTLGSLTALCCVDKKGILSWPNPTAEKVFFLRKNPSSQEKYKESIAEVLDLTHDHQSPFRLHFDDPGWQHYVPNLKPLGLGILLNTCNEATRETYARFNAHIACEAMDDEDFIPVTNRRSSVPVGRPLSPVTPPLLAADPFTVITHGCLCELSKEMGFQDGATEQYKLVTQFFTFRHVLADLAGKDKLARSLSFTKLKFPFPHMASVIVEGGVASAQTPLGSNMDSGRQLLAQGTGEMVLHSCVDYWDGQRVCPLTHCDRKKILDFYHRTSLTAYCTAFAYRPIFAPLLHPISDFYLELPADAHKAPSHMYSSTDSLLSNSQDELKAMNSAEFCYKLQNNAIFLGMVTMQYQARIDMVHLIEQLEKACVRFVHFSKENELRSRVFSEKMGLESGWNCHISLAQDNSSKTRSQSSQTSLNHGLGLQSPVLPPALKSSGQYSHSSVWKRSAEEVSKQTCMLDRTTSLSAPSAIHLEVAQVKFEDEIHLHSLTDDSESDESKSLWEDSARCSLSSVASAESVLCEGNLSRSQSHVTESTEQSAPLEFDMSNRAKLPRGIEEIIPHLEQVDNVPLLVSLFTDCTPRATRRMLSIMQDYGQVICLIGSAPNAHNAPLFMQADASCAVEPLYPQICQHVPAFEPLPVHQGPGPTELARRLNSVACALSFQRDELPSILQLVQESRHLTASMKSMLALWLSGGVALALLQWLAAILMLPPILTYGQVLWLSCITLPLMSLALMGLPTDGRVMHMAAAATGKNQRRLNRHVLTLMLWSYGGKFAPSILFLLLTFTLTLRELCLAEQEDCTWVYLSAKNETWGEWAREGSDLAREFYIIQHGVAFLYVVCLVVISLGLIHRYDQLWQRNPFKNKLWISNTTLALVSQGVFFSASVTFTHEVTSRIPLYVLLSGLAWPFLLLCINELIKMQEIRVNVRLQKRARLEFGTKLGMNSPF